MVDYRICTDAPSELKAHTSSNRMDKYPDILFALVDELKNGHDVWNEQTMVPGWRYARSVCHFCKFFSAIYFIENLGVYHESTIFRNNIGYHTKVKYMPKINKQYDGLYVYES